MLYEFFYLLHKSLNNIGDFFLIHYVPSSSKVFQYLSQYKFITILGIFLLFL